MTKKILVLIGAGILFSGALNLIRPGRLPWVGDWGHRVEAQAIREQVALVQLADMLGFLRDGSRLFVDARPAGEFARGHLPGALSLPFEDLNARDAAVTKVLESAKPAVFYCSGPECDDALLLAVALHERGLENGAVFVGGMELWQAELLATEGEEVP